MTMKMNKLIKLLKAKSYKLKARRGQALIEAIIALTVLTFGMVGIFTLLSNSFGLNKTTTNQYVAVNLAAEGIEMVRNLIDINTMANEPVQTVPWNSGISDGSWEADYNDTGLTNYSGRLLLFDPTSELYSYDLGAGTIFRREIEIENVSLYQIRTISRVTWRDRGGVNFDVVLEDRFFNWR